MNTHIEMNNIPDVRRREYGTLYARRAAAARMIFIYLRETP